MLFYMLNKKTYTFRICYTVHEVMEHLRNDWDNEVDYDDIEVIDATSESLRFTPWTFMNNFYEEGGKTHIEVCEQILHYLVFEFNTSENYPFEVAYKDVTLDDINLIATFCNGNDDTDIIHENCVRVLGKKEAK